MLRSRTYRGAIGFAVATLVLAQGCYVYRPTTLPLQPGAQVRVEGAPLDIYRGAGVQAIPASCHATRLYGKPRGELGDTRIVVPVLGMSHAAPRAACKHIETATVVAAPTATTVSLRHFSPGRTTGLVAGTLLVAATTAAIVIASEYSHYDANLRAH